MKNSVIILVAIIAANLSIFAQNTIYEGVGIFGSYNYNMHETAFSQLPNVPNCCPEFSSGTGNGFSIGLFYEIPLFDDLSGQIRTAFNSLNGNLSQIENEFIIYNDELETADIEHILNTEISTISLALYGRYLIFDKLSIIGGITSAIPVITKYSQKEVLVKPANYGVFENGTRTRNSSEGDIEGVSSFLLFVDFGISYDIPLNLKRSFYLSPEILYSLCLTDILEEEKWKINSFRIGLSFRYSFSYELASPLAPERD